MRIKRLILNNFRNYSFLDIVFNTNTNIFIGDNAQGKTNILEALYVLAITASHRTNNIKELISWNSKNSVIKAECNNSAYEVDLSLRINEYGNKEYYKNGININLKEFFGQVNVVMFSPEDLFLVKGSPAQRRKFLDNEISQTNKYYYQCLLRYNRIIQQRNNLLKTIRDRRKNEDVLEMWDEELSQVTADIIKIRMDAMKRLAMLANLMHRKLTNSQESLKLIYSFNNIDGDIENFNKQQLKEFYLNQLNKVRKTDLEKGYTSIGPHRDDIILKVNDVNIRFYGSQGQQRTGILALKLSELEFVKSQTGQYPVLLLDDVMSELDEQRREQLLLFINNRIQTFITSTDNKLFPSIKGAKYYKVVKGKIAE